MSQSTQHIPEPWLRGPIDGADALTAPILYALEQAREDLAHHTDGLTTAQIWAKPYEFGSVGFHIRHIGRSVDRLMSYLDMRLLSAEQLAGLSTEHAPGATIEKLFAELDEVFLATQLRVRLLDPSTLRDVRTVGRKKLPTTVIGLLTHIAEHTQRHVGQAISAAKLVRQKSE